MTAFSKSATVRIAAIFNAFASTSGCSWIASECLKKYSRSFAAIAPLYSKPLGISGSLKPAYDECGSIGHEVNTAPATFLRAAPPGLQSSSARYVPTMYVPRLYALSKIGAAGYSAWHASTAARTSEEDAAQYTFGDANAAPPHPRKLSATHRHPRAAAVAIAHLVGPSCDPPLMPCSMMNTGASRGKEHASGMLEAVTVLGGSFALPARRVLGAKRDGRFSTFFAFDPNAKDALHVARKTSASLFVFLNLDSTSQSSATCPPSSHRTSCLSYFKKSVNMRP
mmetsp:Transcript_8433/g.35739  ORF Transcript_8433/g.35739 Transcript_8433/m.35739 type:complete len:282 (+) Transcript_8433:676-1521(+)